MALWRLLFFLSTIFLLLGCGRGSKTTGNDAIQFSVARITDAKGEEQGASLDMGNAFASKDVIKFKTLGGLSKNARDALDLVSEEAFAVPNSVVEHLPQRMPDGRYIVAIGSSLPNQTLLLDIEGVTSVEFAEGKSVSWPVTFQQGAVAIDFCYSESGKVAHINEVLQTR